ncbi:hypothetical protein NQ318_009253 [Aromia moschata]|uniref:AVL9/DENND6 domain-containing protein n=1 Tax=Aromia moschata TaxID=1265417 RepID=A0AAV8YAG9_9CUCU|nr:hypothetical protein NQ318_009253 [Aromia moschata]
MDDKEGPILYVLVIGFHHKKGCQVEYSFPPLVPGHPNECPPGWKYLPTLALPDGSHNYDDDTVFFHLPSLTKPETNCLRYIVFSPNPSRENKKSYFGHNAGHGAEICMRAKQDSFVRTDTS